MTKPVGPHARPGTFARINGSTRSGRFLRDERKRLTALVGGNPTTVQAALIERAVMLSLRLRVMDEAFMQTGTIASEHDSQRYLSWTNALTRLLRQLGVQGADQSREPTIADLMARSSAA